MRELELTELSARDPQLSAKIVNSNISIHIIEDDSGIIRICSQQINELADSYHIQKCLDECNCEPVVVWPYCIRSETYLYSYPPNYVVGHGNIDGVGYIMDPTGFTAMEEAHIPHTLRDRIVNYLKGHQG